MPPRRRSDKKKRISAKNRRKFSAGRRDDTPNTTGVGPEIPPAEPTFLQSLMGSTTPVTEEQVVTEEPFVADESSAEIGREPENEELMPPVVAPMEEVKTKKKRKAAKKGTKKNKKPRSRCAAYCRMQKKRFCPPSV